MRAKQVTMEDAMEFEGESRTYANVLEHRRICKKWTKEFCLDCFGGGLTQFTKDLEMEKSLSKTQANPEDLSANKDFTAQSVSPKVCPKCKEDIQIYINDEGEEEERCYCSML